MLFARLFFLLKIKTAFVTVFLFAIHVFCCVLARLFLFVTNDFKAEFCLNDYRFRKSTPASNTFSILRFFKE